MTTQRNNQIIVRMSDKEKELLEKNADNLGMTVSSFIRYFGCYYNETELNNIFEKGEAE